MVSAVPMADLVVVGMAYFEVFVPPHVRPEPGQELFVDGIALGLGGALNTASVAAALGLKVTLCVPMGQGLVDQSVALLAKQLGITLVPLAAPDNPAISLVFSDRHDRSFVSSAKLDVLSQVTELPEAKWVHAPGLEEAARLERPLALARANGARVSVSASWSPGQLRQLTARQGHAWDLLILNEKEAVAACGEASAAPQLLAQAAHSVLVTLGAKGVLGVLDSAQVRATVQPVQSVESTGAGDAFVAGVIAGQLRGMEPGAAVHLGCLAAARILNQTGGVAVGPQIMAGITEEI
jgi:sugar/nucleoside kinase (ribokinase family)